MLTISMQVCQEFTSDKLDQAGWPTQVLNQGRATLPRLTFVEDYTGCNPSSFIHVETLSGMDKSLQMTGRLDVLA